MPAQNLVSATLPADDKAAILAAIETIKSKMPFLLSLQEEQRKKLRTAGTKRMGYVQDVVTAVKAFPKELPQSFDVVEYLKDTTLFTELADVTAALNSLAEEVDDTRIQLSAELMGQSDTAYSMLKSAQRNNAAVKSMVDKISTSFKGQGSDASPTIAKQ